MEIHSEIVVVSDVHLRRPDDTRAQQLLYLIEAMRPPKVRHFVLLGDIFDFCLGSSPYFRSKFIKLGHALHGLVGRGVTVWFFEGNHEFDMAYLGWDGVNIVSGPYRVITLGSGKRVALAHGDLIYSSWDYRLFRGLVKSKAVRRMARLVPGKLIDVYAMGHATLSRRRGQNRRLNHERLLAAAEGWVRQAACDFGVFGHFHVPYAEERAEGNASRPVGIYSLDCWDKPNVLLCDGDGVRRGFLREGGRFEVVEPVSFRALLESESAPALSRMAAPTLPGR